MEFLKNMAIYRFKAAIIGITGTKLDAYELIKEEVFSINKED